MSDSITHEVAAGYAAALAADRTESVLALLAGSVWFQSPFTRWEDPAGVRAAYTARAAAFSRMTILDLIAQHDRAVLLWQAEASGQLVEGCEVLTLSGGEVIAVDVYLRPAAVLPAVSAAMRDAWPR